MATVFSERFYLYRYMHFSSLDSVSVSIFFSLFKQRDTNCPSYVDVDKRNAVTQTVWALGLKPDCCVSLTQTLPLSELWFPYL